LFNSILLFDVNVFNCYQIKFCVLNVKFRWKPILEELRKKIGKEKKKKSED